MTFIFTRTRKTASKCENKRPPLSQAVFFFTTVVLTGSITRCQLAPVKLAV